MESSRLLFGAMLAAVAVAGTQQPTVTRVTARQVLEIGGDTVGTPMLNRVVTALRTREGYLIGDESILVVDAAGKEQRRIGRKGRGPGEFMHVSWIGECAGDSLVVLDGAERRFSVFTGSGEFVRHFPAPQATALARCTLQGTLGILPFPRTGNPPNPNVKAPPDSVAIELLNMKGDMVGRTRSVPFGSNQLFAPVASITMHGASLFVGTGATSAVDEYTLTGKFVRTIPVSLPVVRTSRAQQERAVDLILDGMGLTGDRRAQARTQFLAQPIPNERAPYSTFHASPDGTLWFLTSGLGDTTTVVQGISRDGKRQTIVSLPRTIERFLAAGNDYVIVGYEVGTAEPRVGVFSTVAPRGSSRPAR